MALTNENIRKMVIAWYKKLDVHAPMVEILPFLVDYGLKMKFPEATAEGWAGFESWYQRVIRIFFDEEHTVKVCEAEIDGDEAQVKIIVQWEASIWNPPDDKHHRIKLDAYQTWRVITNNEGKPIVKTYIVDEMKYHEGSAKL